MNNENSNQIITEIIKWWEAKRLLYNGLLLLVGVISIIIGGIDYLNFIGLAFIAVIFNFAYTLGWVVEVLIKVKSEFTSDLLRLRNLFFIVGTLLSILLLIGVYI